MRSTTEEILNDKIQILSVFLIFILVLQTQTKLREEGGTKDGNIKSEKRRGEIVK